MLAEAGPIDLLVANAGVALWEESWETNVDEWWRVLEVNVLGVHLIVRLALPGMIERGGGRIVITGSGASYPGLDVGRVHREQGRGRPFGEVLAQQVKDDNVKVFVISPGLVRTEMTDRFGDDAPWTPPELAPRSSASSRPAASMRSRAATSMPSTTRSTARAADRADPRRT